MFVNFALNDGKGAHEPEKISFSLTVGQRNISNIVDRVDCGQFNVHVIVVLRWRST